jgi:hypothetical protein
MTQITRRSLLKGAAGLSLLRIARPLYSLVELQASPAQCNYGSDTLNVVFHGLFLINVTSEGKDGYVQLLTPEIKDHKYKMGNWKIHETRHLRARREPYQLTGVSCSDALPPLPDKLCPVLSRKEYGYSVVQQPSRFIFNFPFPNRITGVRSVKGDPLIKKDNTVYISNYSLCIVFTYEGVNIDKIHVPGISWRPVRERTKDKKKETSFANLHLWAEPEKRVNPFHSDQAYLQLSTDLLKGIVLEMHTDNSAPIDLREGVSGLPPYQELGWAEWANGGEGTRPRDCCSPISRP